MFFVLTDIQDRYVRPSLYGPFTSEEGENGAEGWLSRNGYNKPEKDQNFWVRNAGAWPRTAAIYRPIQPTT